MLPSTTVTVANSHDLLCAVAALAVVFAVALAAALTGRHPDRHRRAPWPTQMCALPADQCVTVPGSDGTPSCIRFGRRHTAAGHGG